MKPKKSKNSKKSLYVKTTRGVTYRLGHRLMERVDRRTHRLLEGYHFMTYGEPWKPLGRECIWGAGI